MTLIRITKEDKRLGKRGDPARCIIAVTFRRAGYKKVEVSGTNIKGGFVFQGKISGKEVHAKLPEEARLFAKAFDRERRTGLLQFSVDILPGLAGRRSK